MSEEDNSNMSEDDLLQEWQDMATDELSSVQDDDLSANTENDSDDRILDQGEIDSLLGLSEVAGENRSGIRALLDTNVVNYERLPMLDIIFDKFERYLSTSLRHFTADNVDITIDNITTIRFGDYLDSVPLPAGIAVVNAVGLDDYILLVYESRLVYAIVDILLGGRKTKPARVDGRTFSPIERKIIDTLSEVVLSDLSEAFAPIAPIQFTAERMEVNPRFANITRPGNAAILATLRINLEEREGIMQFCLPYATLEPIRDQLLQQFMGEKFGQDNIWENHLMQELYHTNIEMKAVLEEFEMPLSKVINWRLGDTIDLTARADSEIQVKCGKTIKLTGSMGKFRNKTAIKIKKTVSDVNNQREDYE